MSVQLYTSKVDFFIYGCLYKEYFRFLKTSVNLYMNITIKKKKSFSAEVSNEMWKLRES